MNLDLFNPSPQVNLLPFEGWVQDYGLVLTEAEASDELAYYLTHLAWQPDEVILYGKHIRTRRQVAWYGDTEFAYHYSGITRYGHCWDSRLLALKHKIEALTGQQFNSCLANLYQEGRQGMGWHSDNENTLGPQPVIASLSLGATRKFCFRHNSRATRVELLLQHGQLLVMQGQTQRYWKHALMKSTRVQQPRINLTFRLFRPML